MTNAPTRYTRKRPAHLRGVRIAKSRTSISHKQFLGLRDYHCGEKMLSGRNLGGNSHGKGDQISRAGLDRLGRVQVGPQFVPRNLRYALYREHPQRRDFIPLRNSLLRDTERLGQASQPANGFDCALQRCFAFAHGG